MTEERKENEQNLEYEQHRKYIDAILQVDAEKTNLTLNQLHKDDRLLDEKMRSCLQQLKNIRLIFTTYRTTLFHNALTELFKSQSITESEQLKLSEFIFDKLGKEEPHVLKQSEYFSSPYIKYQLKSAIPELIEREEVWSRVIKAASDIDQLEEHLTLKNLGADDLKEHQRLSKQLLQLRAHYEANQPLKKELQKRDREMLELFKPENILDGQALKNLIHQIGNKKIELMIINPKIILDVDADVGAVIEMRATKTREGSNKELILMSFDRFNQIINEGHPINGITKLSFLHHALRQFDYTSRISTYIDQMPTLKQIVLRGCGSAESRNIDQETRFKVTLSKKSYDDIPSIQGMSNLVVQQQKKPNGEDYITKVSWAICDPETKERIIKEIADITSLSQISKNPTIQQLQELERIEGIPLLEYPQRHIASMKKLFFKEKKVLSTNEYAHIKKVILRSRTVSETNPKDSLLSKVWNKMTPEQQEKISVKAYVGGYEIQHGRVNPEIGHDQGKLPKAVRIGPKQ